MIDFQELWVRLAVIDIPIHLEIAFGMTCVYVLLLGTARFKYELREDELRMSWRILGFIPFWSWRIEVSRIRRLRNFHRRDAFRNAIVFGRLPSRQPAILELNSGRFSLVYVTPSDRTLLASALPGGDFE